VPSRAALHTMENDRFLDRFERTTEILNWFCGNAPIIHRLTIGVS